MPNEGTPLVYKEHVACGCGVCVHHYTFSKINFFNRIEPFLLPLQTINLLRQVQV
jgi:hypothetical protein